MRERDKERETPDRPKCLQTCGTTCSFLYSWWNHKMKPPLWTLAMSFNINV